MAPRAMRRAAARPTHRGRRLRAATMRAAGAGAALLVLAGLAACAPEDAPSGSGGQQTPSASTSASAGPTGTPTPSPSATFRAEIPDDCREMLTAAVLDQLDGVPLNDPAFGASGPQADGSLVCVWRDPAADTTGLMTTISYMSRGPALDMLNQLVADEGFACYTPTGGTRCEKTWPNPTYPVTDGRTLFWRDDILIDTVYSNLAPSGYTDAVVGAIFD
ncbi:hypothetical protein R8Z57_13800 [Microbacterium sp. M3]|uniref:DUF3558 domain-containing protein n=1 Tax=Microbacterium arthrosphaerae TaxID=792652 RepID=A0ABU4H3E1_9MICO|nr:MULTISPECIES: hypothetical protein [Microbacterium]MDW4573850.1 hypothetical protein [Microbacterium arthrosphaerae]MDW7607705.1 hypothetical protein [Microbacterium sp. M3]